MTELGKYLTKLGLLGLSVTLHTASAAADTVSGSLINAQIQALQRSFHSSQLFSPGKELTSAAVAASYGFFIKDNKQMRVTVAQSSYLVTDWRLATGLGPLVIDYQALDYLATERQRYGMLNLRLNLPLLSYQHLELATDLTFTAFQVSEELATSEALAGKPFQETSWLNFLNRVSERLQTTTWYARFERESQFRRFATAAAAEVTINLPLWASHKVKLTYLAKARYAYSLSYLQLTHGVANSNELRLVFFGNKTIPNFTLQTGVYFSSSFDSLKNGLSLLLDGKQQATDQQTQLPSLTSSGLMTSLSCFTELGFKFNFKIVSDDFLTFIIGYKLSYFPAATDDLSFNFRHGASGRFEVSL